MNGLYLFCFLKAFRIRFCNIFFATNSVTLARDISIVLKINFNFRVTFALASYIIYTGAKATIDVWLLYSLPIISAIRLGKKENIKNKKIILILNILIHTNHAAMHPIIAKSNVLLLPRTVGIFLKNVITSRF